MYLAICMCGLSFIRVGLNKNQSLLFFQFSFRRMIKTDISLHVDERQAER